MTKTNKTLLCALLALVLTLACALTIMPVAGTKANAENGVKTYRKITASMEDWSGKYLIVSEKGSVSCFDGSLPSSSLTKSGNLVTIEINNETVIGDYTNQEFLFEKKGDGYSIKGTNGLYIGRDENRNGLDNNPTKQFVNTVSYDDTNGIVIKGAGGAKLQFLNQKNSYTFKYYTSNQSAIALYKLEENTHTHAYSEWTHVDGTKTHVKTCNVDGCDAPTVTEACTIVNNVCTVCNYDYTAKFTVKETVVAAESQTSLAIDAEG